jgi:small subunit ribosomal protein S20
MPHTESAKKRLRQNEKRRLANKARTTEIKTIRKQVLRALGDGKNDDAQTLYRELTKCLDQAAGQNVIHRNTAARTKARIAERIHAAATKTKTA